MLLQYIYYILNVQTKIYKTYQWSRQGYSDTYTGQSLNLIEDCTVGRVYKCSPPIQ